MSENIQMGENLFVLPIDMDNRSVEDIAREAVLRINDVCDQVAKQREAEKKAKEEEMKKGQ